MTAVTSLARVVPDARTNGVLRILLTALSRRSRRTVPGMRNGARRLTLGTQAVVALAVLLLLVVLVSLAASTYVVRGDLTRQYEQRALAIARSVAADPGVAAEVTGGEPSTTGPVQRDAERIRRGTQALYVVVTDGRGIRYSHPTTSNVGKMVSTSPDEALSGRDVVTVEKGTLGYSARGKVPLRAADGTVVGEVSVGIATSELDAETRKLVILLALVALAPLAVGLAGAVALARRLRRSTLGLSSEEMADLVREHVAVLGGVRDGVLAVDRSGSVTVSNAEAVRLLGADLRRGRPISESGVGREVLDLLAEEPAPSGALRVVGGRVVVASRLPVERDGRDLGAVLILRDRSDLDQLARELEATRALTDALRAQAHEHSNRLHTLTGLLHYGDVDEAASYLSGLSESSTWVSAVADPYLAGLLAAKSAAASEAGVQLVISPETWLADRLVSPLDTITVVANLIDNGIRAAKEGVRTPREVVVTLVGDDDDLLVHVEDSGDGVRADHADQVFGHGFTTREGEGAGHGIGLALARQTARTHGGDVRLVSEGTRERGAAFEAVLVGVLGLRPVPERGPR
ncbi:MAG: putative two-component system histidine kinase [Nocardioidaceae bacterium]|nr:putative two-component system histidine kinase [Nocardioidaceae bacterium]